MMDDLILAGEVCQFARTAGIERPAAAELMHMRAGFSSSLTVDANLARYGDVSIEASFSLFADELVDSSLGASN